MNCKYDEKAKIYIIVWNPVHITCYINDMYRMYLLSVTARLASACIRHAYQFPLSIFLLLYPKKIR